MNNVKNKKKKGFTLIELIAVVAILAVLAAVAVPKVISYVNKSKRVAVQTTASTICNAAEAAYNDGSLEAVKSADKKTETPLGDAKVSAVVKELEDNHLINNIDTTKLGTLKDGNMSALQAVADENQENIDVNSEGVYQGNNKATA